MPERDEAAVVEGLHDDAAAIWNACLESLDGAGSTHKAWLAQIRPVAVSGDTLVLAVPDDFVKEWIEQRYAPTVVAALGASAADDRAAGTGAHPDPEAMRLGAFTVVRLKCTLHDDGS